MKISSRPVFSPEYEVDIGSHVFPTAKYRLIKERLIEEYGLRDDEFLRPSGASKEEVMRVHDKKYVLDIAGGTISIAEQIRLELPYSKELAKAAFICCAGTSAACNEAAVHGSGVHIGGGFHHAFADHGEGFCVFNDIALGILNVRDKFGKILVVDCDLHQGNGTASIFHRDENVFTFSMHQENNYPFNKEKSDLDINLTDGTTGEEYNKLLSDNLESIISGFEPGFIIYVAGADTYMKDVLGGLALTIEDLEIRDTIVKGKAGSIPVCVVLAGGYAADLSDTVKIHTNTAVRFLGSGN